MKTAETKTAAATSPHLHQAGKPFFQKKGKSSFFSDSQTDLQTKPFFSKQAVHPIIQTKLTIGKPGDKYEQEADAMADQVVQRLSNSETIQTKSLSLASTVTPVIQPKCSGCEEEEQVQKKEEDDDRLESVLLRKSIFESDEPPPEDDIDIHRKCAECEEEEKLQKQEEGRLDQSIQRKSEFKSVDLPPAMDIQRKCAECEAEEKLQKKEEGWIEQGIHRKNEFKSVDLPPAIDIQRKCAECEAEEKLQKKEKAEKSGNLSSSLESRLSSSKGSGRPLPNTTRGEMESSFGADFSNVRIHTGSSAVNMNKDLHAQAFTHGSDIYFNSGKYNTENTAGKHLLAHELTHTLQQGHSNLYQLQRYSWDEFTDDVSSTADSAGETLLDASEAIVDTVVETGETIYETGAEAIDVVEDAASQAVDWLATEAGQFAKDLVAALGGTIRITAAGIEVRLPRMCPIGAIPLSHRFDPFKKDFMVPIFNFPIGPDIFISGAVGIVGSIAPEIQLQLGPFCLEGAHLLINPITNNYSISGSVSATAAAALGAEVRGGVKATLGLMAITPIGPITIPVLGGEGGLAGMIRGIGAGRFTLGGSLTYSGGIITSSGAAQLEMGLGADLFAGAYAQLSILDENICRIYWQPYEWHGNIAAALGITANLTIVPGGTPSIIPVINNPTLGQIPFDQIPLVISRKGFSDDCPIIDKVCKILKALNLLPSQNGGVWDWGGTGHGGVYGPGSLLAGPKEVYQRNPGIASGSTCRGACGPNCDTCEPYSTYVYVDPATGDVWQYTNYEDCNSNNGCREHDAAFDWAADAKGETGRWAIIMPWHMAGNIECACNNLAGNCVAWVAGLPPYDMKMYFADNASKISSGTGPGPGGVPGLQHSDEPIGEWGPDFYHYSRAIPSGNFSAGVERWTDYRTNCRAEAQAATGVPDNLNYITVLSDTVADQYIDSNQFNTRFFTSIVYGSLIPANHYRNHTEIPPDAYSTTTLDIFTPDCSSSSGTGPTGASEEEELEQCDRGQLPPDYCEELYDRVIERFGNRDRNLDFNPDEDVDEGRTREDDAPIMSSFRKMYNRLDSWNIYILTRHPDWYPEFDSRFKVNDKKIEWMGELKTRTKTYKNRFRDARNQDTEQLRREFMQRDLDEIQDWITTLLNKIATWYKAKTGSTEDLNAIIERVHLEGTEMWRGAWRAAILAVNRILSRLWPTAKARINGWVAGQRRLHPGVDLSGTVGDVDYIGSLATGFKGAPKQFSRFNPDKFDVDGNLVAPPLAKFAVNIMGILPDRERIFAIQQNTTITPLINFCNDAHRELLRVDGYDDNPDEQFDVVIEAKNTASQQRSVDATQRIYSLRPVLGTQRYNRLITELRAAGLLIDIGNSWQLKTELTHTENAQFNAILRRYE